MDNLSKLAEEIFKRGVIRIFGIPGSGNSLKLIDKLEKKGVDFCLTHFEGSAAIMAGTTGRLSGKAGVAVSIKGPGLANMIPGLALSCFEGFPLVAIAESYAPDAPLSKAHKRLDHDKLVSAVAKGRRFLSKKGCDFNSLCAWAEAETPGPVLLDLTEEYQSGQKIPARQKRFSGSDFKAVRKLIVGSKRPIVIAGTLALRRPDLCGLNSLRIPVFSTAAAKGVIDESCSHSAGVYTGTGLDMTIERNLLPDADLVIGIGLRPNEVLNATRFGCAGLNVVSAHDALAMKTFGFKHEAGWDRYDELRALLNGKTWGLDIIRERTNALEDRLLNGPFLPAHVFRHVSDFFQGRARIVVDTGDFCTVAEHIWKAGAPDRYLSSGQGRYMGVAIPMGIAASIHDRNIPTVIAVGDGGIGPFIAEVKIAVERRLPIVIVLLTDGGFGSIRRGALKAGLTVKPLNIGNSSWIEAMRGFGVKTARVSDSASLRGALQEWRRESGPLYIEIPFEKKAYERMTEGIRP